VQSRRTAQPSTVAAATIPVEQFEGELVLVVGGDDRVWPSHDAAHAIMKRRSAHGRTTILVEDADAGHLEAVEAAYRAGNLGRPHLDAVTSRRLRNISSLCFGGRDLRDVWLGCLLGDSLEQFRAPVAGLPPIHWEWGREHPCTRPSSALR
jgi:hypothetical protein